MTRPIESSSDLDGLSFDAKGLVPVVAQDVVSGRVLMVAWANRDALDASLETGAMHYWSRSRAELWRKGATSGNTQAVVSLHRDCDSDTVLARVRTAGPACHTGDPTCFGSPPAHFLDELSRVLGSRAGQEGSYTARLLADENLRTKKIGEETAELIQALVRGDRDAIRAEGADLLYHVLVALQASNVTLGDIVAELDNRRNRDPHAG